MRPRQGQDEHFWGKEPQSAAWSKGEKASEFGAQGLPAAPAATVWLCRLTCLSEHTALSLDSLTDEGADITLVSGFRAPATVPDLGDFTRPPFPKGRFLNAEDSGRQCQQWYPPGGTYQCQALSFNASCPHSSPQLSPRQAVCVIAV